MTGANPDDEVIRVLYPADPGNPAADAWNIVTVARPRGGSSQDWTVCAVFGPMAMDQASEVLGGLGVDAVSIADHADFRALEGLLRESARTGRTLGGPAGIAMPRTVAMNEALISQFGAEYAAIVVRAVEADNRGDQARYRENAAIAAEALAAMGRDRSICDGLVASHVGVFLGEIRADVRKAVASGALARPAPPDDQPGEGIR